MEAEKIESDHERLWLYVLVVSVGMASPKLECEQTTGKQIGLEPKDLAPFFFP